ncbi:hypothetical protein [Muricoccus nepalensis]|uniref:hypothetical protein n=1 Tax=Muricoccus nepalensis TaxID=1854500 RepID=UPI00138750D8|nr:hypothetical protein [Roseomonas nepalensis]
MFPNPFRPGRTALLGLHAAGVVATHVMAGAVLGALGVAAVAAMIGKRVAEAKEPR